MATKETAERLQDAAPEMYLALKHAKQALEMAARYLPDNRYPATNTQIVQAHTEVIQALAIAERAA